MVETSKYCQWGGETSPPILCWSVVKWHNTGEQFDGFFKDNHTTIVGILGQLTQRSKDLYSHKNLHGEFHGSFVHKSPTQETTQMSLHG
jgi:hypothetical protein